METLKPKLFEAMKNYSKKQLIKDIISGIIYMAAQFDFTHICYLSYILYPISYILVTSYD